MKKRAFLHIYLAILTIIFCGFNLSGNLPELQKAERYFKNQQYDSAYYYGKRAFEQLINLDKDSILIRSAVIAGVSAAYENLEDSISFIDVALTMAYDRKNPLWMAETENAKGKYLYLKGLYGEALPYFLRVDSLSGSNNFKNETTVESMIFRSEISRMAFTPQSVDSAFDLMMEALNMASEIRSESMENLIYLHLSDLQGLREKYEEAKNYADRAFDYYLNKDDVKKVSRIYWIYTSYYQVKGDVEKCEKSHLDRLDYLHSKNNPGELASAQVAYGNFLRRSKDDCSKALDYFSKSKKIYEDLGDVESDRYLRLVVGMAICCAGTGDYRQAYELYDLAYGLKADAMQKANQELTRELETKYQTRQKEREIALLSAENELARQQSNNERVLYIGLLLLLSLVAAMLFYGYKNKIKTATRLQELDEMKSRFFANISHEFRTPLTLIKSPVQSLLNVEDSTENVKKLQLIDRNAEQMLTLVDQLLELSKLDGGSIKLILKRGSLASFLQALSEPFEYEAAQKNIAFNKFIPNSAQQYLFDKDALTKIVTNLLSNAIKYTPAGSSVSITSQIDSETLAIEVSNTGVSLSQHETEKIFVRFYQKDDTKPGAGIGLALTRELVLFYGGEINVRSENNQVVFNLTLPLNPNKIKNAVIIDPEKSIENSSDTTENYTKTGEVPLMLIAEDNSAILEVLKELFGKEYQILEAKDGLEALRTAQREVPDIIISDVMMPAMNGYDFAKSIKDNEVTSFIPVVLLTAKTGDAAHLQGLQSQADAFLTKPFNNDILKAKVDQLLRERSKLRERYSQELVLKPKDIVLNSADEKFMQRLQYIIDNKLETPDFSSDDFASEVGMSRMQLHRKLKSLTGLSATEFIRSERLKIAATLLSKGNLTISEIAYAVGFNDVSYFSKCFREQYTVTPSEFMVRR